jgi:hypothetical protein
VLSFKIPGLGKPQVLLKKSKGRLHAGVLKGFF